MNRRAVIALSTACASLACGILIAAQPAPEKPLDQAELERQFAETMTGATLVGSFTTRGKPVGELAEDRYELGEVRKLRDDYWLIESRIRYGDHDVKVPLQLQVKWAGDTPVITLTNLPVPGLGTFTARVLVFRDEYAGTWDAGDHGGQMFGRLVRKGAEEKPASAEQE